MHPFDEILKWLPDLDFAVLAHGWAKHGRDYLIVIEDCLGGNPGQHELTLTALHRRQVWASLVDPT